MKKLFCPIAAILMFVTFLVLTSCKKDQAQPSLENQIVGKWTMDAAIADETDYGVSQEDTTRFTANDYFDFKADGTLSIMATGIPYQGNWKVTGDTLVFTNTNYVDFAGGFVVLNVNQSVLQLDHSENTPPDHYLDAKLNFKR